MKISEIFFEKEVNKQVLFNQVLQRRLQFLIKENRAAKPRGGTLREFLFFKPKTSLTYFAS